MILTVSTSAEPVLVFEARLVNADGETLALGRGSTPTSARALATLSQQSVDAASHVEVKLVGRFRVPVVDEQGRWMYIGYGATAQEARADAAFWVFRQPATVH